jgi:hypothetical protein
MISEKSGREAISTGMEIIAPRTEMSGVQRSRVGTQNRR